MFQLFVDKIVIRISYWLNNLNSIFLSKNLNLNLNFINKRNKSEKNTKMRS